MARLTPDSALAAYLAMPVPRSLRKLTVSVPEADRVAEGTIKAWSSKGGWVARAAEYDANVREKVIAKVASAAIRSGTSRLLRMHGFVDTVYERVTELAAKAETAGDAKDFVEMALATEKQAQVMTGGVSDRTEQLGTGSGETAAARLARIERETNEKYGFKSDLNGEDHNPPAAKPH